MSLSFEISTTLPVPPQRVYDAWLNSQSHTDMTGSGAIVSDEPGGSFQAWDGYIEGKNLELEPGHRILQAWRTVEFTDNEPDSRLELIFEAVDGGTLLTLLHSNLPAHGMQYKDGWRENYFEPMQAHFSA